jgi:hypothetical protein
MLEQRLVQQLEPKWKGMELAHRLAQVVAHWLELELEQWLVWMLVQELEFEMDKE